MSSYHFILELGLFTELNDFFNLFNFHPLKMDFDDDLNKYNELLKVTLSTSIVGQCDLEGVVT